jgi:hypothetical protein
MVRRLSDDGPARIRFSGPVDFLMPDGAHFIARCEARYTRERWQGVLNLSGFARGLEQGDVCRLTADRLGELRVVITEKIGSYRYEFVGLVAPDPMETI